MSLKLNTALGGDIRLQSQVNITFLTSFHRPRRRQRLKRSSYHQLSSSSYSSQANLIHAFLSQLNSLDLLAPALGLTSALAILYNTTRTTTTTSRHNLSHEFGKWSLFTSPTPFNRFVKSRCASLLLEQSNEELVKEDGHFYSFDRGRIQQVLVNDYTDDILSYQRTCVITDDGGVISLDWPANLSFTDEHGLDTTVLIVPGTTEGSMDENVRSFAYDCLTHGCFPIVMNPRGCARSPMTTPRLFTAADSDDICTAVQFINSARPWTTLMGVGLGYGANMLTKYLAQVGEETPLTAAVCLDNPFDLKKAAESPNQNLINGLIDILQSNKELFQGRSKGFDVERALQARSLKDFDKAISMVSYGFDSIEEFYANSSTRDVVGNIKIPLLFVQNNEVPSCSAPRSSIVENPFTSLLMCSFPSLDESTTPTSAVSWSQDLVIEWLTAVEFGLLKGRHPLLEDRDVTIAPSKRLPLSSKKYNLLNLRQLDDSNGSSSYPSKKMLKTNDVNVNSQKPKTEDKEVNTDTDEAVTQTNVVDTLLEKEGDAEVVDGEDERGKVLQASEVVMNMLDKTMPETLSEEQKKKVLAAVGRGETLMNALEGAVPEDVRGKLSGAVNSILQNQKSNLNGLSNIARVPDVLKIQENPPLKEPNTSEGDTSKVTEDSNNHPSKNESSGGGEEPESETSGKSEDSQSTSQQGDGDVSDSSKTISHDELGTKEKISDVPDADSNGVPNVSSSAQDSGSSGDQQVKPGPEGETAHSNIKEDKGDQKKDAQQKDEKDPQSSTDQTNSSVPNTEENSTPSASSAENQSTAKDGEIQKNEEPSAQPAAGPSSSGSSSFSVSNALDALTGMDDSTQVAVNSVFSVIEEMITQFEGNEDDGSAAGDEKKVEDTPADSVPKKNHDEIESDLQKKQDEKVNMKTEPKEAVNHQQNTSISELSAERKHADEVVKNIPHSVAKLPHKRNSLYDQSYLLPNKHDKLDATDLHLDYVPEVDQWKLPEQSSEGTDINDDNTLTHDDVIEPAYIILEGDHDWDPLGGSKQKRKTKEKNEIGDEASVELMQLVKESILNSLKVEVSRRIPATDMVDLAPVLKKELEEVASTISLAVVQDKQLIMSWDGEHLLGPGDMQAEHILDAISTAVQGTKYMKKVIPVGIVVGSSLASLRKKFSIAAEDADSIQVVKDQSSNSKKGYHLQEDSTVSKKNPLAKVNENKAFHSLDDSYEEEEEDFPTNSLTNDSVMVGAVTAALGASALLVHQDSFRDGVESVANSMSFNQQENHEMPEEEMSKSSDNNIVTSFAEKAMAVAGPVVPMKEDGGVDQDRLVALLADFGQRGGILRLVGKVALLWGGIRGAMSLTGKLISFLHLSERPLLQRLLGFVFMVLVLWTPVVVPLLPTLVQNWATHNSSNIAELACVVGLYGSIMLLIVLWGKRIRGYEAPFKKYGLELTSVRQIRNCLFGFVGGTTLVLFIQYTNVLLGFASLSGSTVPSATDAVSLLKLSGKVVAFVGQGVITSTAIALVEELFFRSWLPEEIASDLGYNRGIILSALAFSLCQWSLKAVPGLWLLSLGLAGVRQKYQGSLAVPIGLRAGIMASSFIIKTGGFLTYQPTYPLWAIGGDPFQPFTNIVGLGVAILGALLLYPRKPQDTETLDVKIKDFG